MNETGARLTIADIGILTDAFKLKPAKAIEFLRQKGYRISWNWYDTWKQEHLHAFTVAKVTRLDILQDIRDMVDKSIDEGLPFSEFKRQLEPQLKAKGWWGKQTVETPGGASEEVQLGSPYRLKTIYETNTRTAYARGKWDGQQAAKRSRPYLQFLAIKDNRTTDRCLKLHGSIFPIDDPVWDIIYPPNHWHCRSHVRSVSQREVDRDSLVVQSSVDRIVEQGMQVGGETVVFRGVSLGDQGEYYPSPGWDYNPGKIDFKPDPDHYDPDLRKHL